MRVKHYKPRVQSNVLLIVVAWSLGNRGPLSIVVFCRALLFYGQKDVPTFLYLVNRCLKLKKIYFFLSYRQSFDFPHLSSIYNLFSRDLGGCTEEFVTSARLRRAIQ